VISIYNNDFTTPTSRFPYFIDVYRCVIGGSDCRSDTGSYPVPLKKEKVVIVVPDLTNNHRDPKNKPMFYKYVVYNHMSCTCGKYPDNRTPQEFLMGKCNYLVVIEKCIIRKFYCLPGNRNLCSKITDPIHFLLLFNFTNSKKRPFLPPTITRVSLSQFLYRLY
jgi:hypothetical protein